MERENKVRKEVRRKESSKRRKKGRSERSKERIILVKRPRTHLYKELIQVPLWNTGTL